MPRSPIVDYVSLSTDDLAQISVSKLAMLIVRQLGLPCAAASRSWPIMPELAGRFTLSEMAALRIVADELN